MNENKAGKYLKYALGEISLVVIGILIALSLNNWNQDRIEKDKAYSYLSQIQEELKADEVYFDILIGKTDNFIKSIKNAVNSNFVNDTTLPNIGKSLTFNTDKREFGRTYQSMESSGLLQLIEEKGLIRKLDDYYRVPCKRFNDLAEYHKQFMTLNIEGVLIHRLSYNENGRLSTESLRSDYESGKLVSILNWQLYILSRVKEDSESCRKLAHELQVLIKKETITHQ